jgi:signal transduction histidine kinase
MRLIRSLSGRLLIVTMLAVMVIEALIFAPSVARFRLDYLQERLRMAELASLAILATPEEMLDPELEAELLERAGAVSIVLRRDGARALVLSDPSRTMIEASYDLRGVTAGRLLIDALVALAAGRDAMIRVIGAPAPGRDVVEVTLPQGPMRDAMRAYGVRILGLSLIISVGAAILIYLLARRLLVRPMARIVASMTAFRENPDDPTRVIRPGSRVTEIALAEQTLAEMQADLRAALRQKARLAALGEAVAKIAHDLRNMLATAQLLADRIETSRDPVMARIGPKIVGSLDRAVGLCESTLRFGAAREAPPAPRRTPVAALAAEVGDAVFPDADIAGTTPAIRFRCMAAPDAAAMADPDHLFRILANLVRNARNALEAAGRDGAVTVSARVDGPALHIDVADDGPGLPEKALENLYQAFRGGATPRGSGLGLAIAQELAAMQGGAVTLLHTGPDGAAFRVTVPAAN